MPDNQIGLEAVFENEDFQKGISEYNRAVSDADSNTASAGSRMSEIWSGMAAVGEAAFTAIAAVVGAFVAELGLAVLAAFEAEDALARVEFIVDNVAERTGVTTEEVDELASSLSSVVPIDDEVIAQAAAMGLTFDGVNEGNIQPLLGAAADLAEFTGKDLPNSMKTLSLAITDPDRAMRLFKDANITLTKEQEKTLKGLAETGDTAGTTAFILEQLANKGILGLAEAMGDTARGKFTIMQTALGNLQEALGEGLLESLKGVFDRITEFAQDPRTITFFTDLGNRVGGFAETVLSKLPDIMTAIQGLGDWFIENKPLIVGILAALGVALIAFGGTAAAAAFSAISAFAPLIIAIVAIGAVAALLFKAWDENWGGVQEKVKEAWSQIKPVFDQLLDWLKDNLPKALKILSKLWTDTLLPAIKKAFTWIVDNVLPILVKLVLWLGENVPKAIKETSNFFQNTLLPAVKAVGNWIDDTLIPILQEARDWFQTHVVNGIRTLVQTIQSALISALNTLSNVWRNVLLPAIQAVTGFIQNTLIPIFNAVANLMDAVVGLAVRVLAGIWQNFLLPALQAVWSVIQNVVSAFNTVVSTISGPIISATNTLADLWRNVLRPAIQELWDRLSPFANFLNNTLRNAFEGIRSVVQDVVGWINDLADSINNLTLPDWLTPGSPTPFELGLVGINKQLKELANTALPAVTQEMNVLSTVRDVPGVNSPTLAGRMINSSNNVNNYLYGARFNVNNSSGLLEILAGLS